MHAHTMAPSLDAELAGDNGALALDSQVTAVRGAASVEVNRRMVRTRLAELTELAPRLAAMDQMGVEVQLVSLTPAQCVYLADSAIADRVVRVCNTWMADLVAQCPSRLVGLGVVSLHDPARAVAQLTEVVGRHGLRGVELSTMPAGRELSDPDLDVFWSAAVDMNALIQIHPTTETVSRRLRTFYMSNIVGYPIEHAIGLMHLILGGVFDRHPRLRILATHGGGYLPHQIGRADHAWRARPDTRGCAEPPSSYLSRLHVDSLVFEPAELARLLEIFGYSQVVLGTDFPYDMGIRNPIERLDKVSTIPREDRLCVLEKNARKLLSP